MENIRNKDPPCRIRFCASRSIYTRRKETKMLRSLKRQWSLLLWYGQVYWKYRFAKKYKGKTFREVRIQELGDSIEAWSKMMLERSKDNV